MRLASAKDLCSGLLFFCVGTTFAFGAEHYNMGTAARMGPGYFPRLLGIILAIAGLICVARAFRGPVLEDGSIGAIAWRPLVAVLAALGLFALLLPHIGFLLSVAVLVAVGSLAAQEVRPFQIAVAAVVLAVSCWLVFVKGLGLPFPAASLFG